MLVCILTRRKKFSLSVPQSVAFTLLLTATGVVGAKLLFFMESGFQGWEGISFFGSVFLIPLLVPLSGYLFRLTPGQPLDLCAPCVAIMIAVLRVNCFLSGCCGGWSVCIGSLCFHWPTQIIESFGDVFILYQLLSQENKSAYNGRLYPSFMILYGVLRFFIEFLRDTPKNWLMMSHGQWFAVASILIGALWILWKKTKGDTNEYRS